MNVVDYEDVVKVEEAQNELVSSFEEKNMVVFKAIRDITQAKKKLEAEEKKAKESILEQMKKYGIKSIDNEVVKITYVPPSESVSVDLKAFEKNEPNEYKLLLRDYPKVTKRKDSLRITVR